VGPDFVVTALSQGATTQQQKASRLYAWVRRHVRYCAVEVGIGGWQPHASDAVFDVGYGDFAAKLRDDPRIELHERTNARALEPLDPPADLVVMDVSFISITTVLPAVVRSVAPGGDLLLMVKPQFEAGSEAVEKGGVVRDPVMHAGTVAKVMIAALDLGLRVRGIVRSPLLGPAGNREFFLWARVPDHPLQPAADRTIEVPA
ncbi:MAG: SAM-dependent methyltransferase, partial [Chloroflexota bacterium]